MRSLIVVLVLGLVATFAQPARAQVTGDAPGVRPDAIVDLKTDEGMALVKGQWRVQQRQSHRRRSSQPGSRPRSVRSGESNAGHRRACRCRRFRRFGMGADHTGLVGRTAIDRPAVLQLVSDERDDSGEDRLV